MKSARKGKSMKPMAYCILLVLTVVMAIYRISYANTDGTIFPFYSGFYYDVLLDACNMPLPIALLLLGTGLIGFVGVPRSGHHRPTGDP
jgi:hypothetical protein